MPYFNIEVDEFLFNCDRRDIDDLIDALVEDGYIPKGTYNLKNPKNEKASNIQGRGEMDFSEKLEQLKKKYYSLSEEDESKIEEIFKKYI